MSSENTLSAENLKEPGFWREIWQQARLIVHLMRDPDVPIYLKIIPFLGFIYLLIPIDLIPDPLLFLGQLDDITALLIGSKMFIELVPPEIVAKHMQAIREQDGFAPLVEKDLQEDEISESIIINGDHEVLKGNK